MPGHLMVLNPARRKRRKARKMTAKQRKFFGRRKHGRKSSRRPKVVIVSTNPRGGSMARRRKFRRNPKKHHHRISRRRFRRNPIGSGFMSGTLVPAAIGAAGAVAVDWLGNNLPLPPSLYAPGMAPLTRIGLALLVGVGVDAIAGPKAGTEAAAGGIIVALYNYASQNLLTQMGGGGGYGYGGGMQRYIGFVRRNGRLGNGALNVNNGRLGPVGPVGLRPLGASPSNVTKFRVLRAQGGGQRLGYTGPARTMGRYANGR